MIGQLTTRFKDGENVLLFLVIIWFYLQKYKTYYEISQKLIIHFILGALRDGEFRGVLCDKFYTGRYVAIYMPQGGILSVCEFEVYAGRYPWGLF